MKDIIYISHKFPAAVVEADQRDMGGLTTQR